MSDEKNNRIARLEAMLKARTDREGRPLYGYNENVYRIRNELASLRGEPQGD